MLQTGSAFIFGARRQGDTSCGLVNRGQIRRLPPPYDQPELTGMTNRVMLWLTFMVMVVGGIADTIQVIEYFRAF